MRLSESPLKVLGRICVELRRNDGDSFASATACFERDTALGLCDVVLGCDGAVDARRQERVEVASTTCARLAAPSDGAPGTGRGGAARRRLGARGAMGAAMAWDGVAKMA